MRRRDLLLAGIGGVLASAVRADPPPAMKIIDCHTHFYDPSRPQGVPWPGKNDKVLYRTVLPDEYKKIAGPLGITGTVVVEASPWLEDNQWLLDLAAKDHFILGIVGRLDIRGDDFEQQVKRFAANPLFRGIRISQEDLKVGLEGKIVERCKLLTDRDLELDINGGPAMLTDVARLAERSPTLRIVVNHCGNLKIDGREPPQPWRDGMQAAAAGPNVFCKVSALVEQTAAPKPPRDVAYYRPVLDVLWKCFGVDRLIFGTNWPVSDRAAPLETVSGIVRDYVAALGPEAMQKFYFDNSRRAYKWRER